MKILMTLIALLKLTRLTQGQSGETNPFKPSFGFRSSLNSTFLSFGLNDQVTSINNRFNIKHQPTSRINKKISRTKSLIPDVPKQTVNALQNIPNFPKQTVSAIRNIPNFPKQTGRVDTKNNKISLIDTGRAALQANSISNGNVVSKIVPSNLNTVSGKVKNNVGSSSPLEEIVSMNTVKQGLNVANALTNHVSEDSIRQKFINFFIKNSKKSKKGRNDGSGKKSAAFRNTVQNANSSKESRFILGPDTPLSQIAQLMTSARSNSTKDSEAPTTFFIGPILVPAHTIENARDDPNGRTITSPLIALPFSPDSQTSNNIHPLVPGDSVRTVPQNLPLVSPAKTATTNTLSRNTNTASIQTSQVGTIPGFRRSPHSDIQNILDASLSVTVRRPAITIQRSLTPVVRNHNIGTIGNRNARNNGGIRITRTRVRQPARANSQLNNNRDLVPVNIARQTVQAIRMRNQLSRQSNGRSGATTAFDATRQNSILQPTVFNQNSVDLSRSSQNTPFQVRQTATRATTQTQTATGATTRTQANRTPFSQEVNLNNVFSQATGNQNGLSPDLAQFFVDPTQLSADELARLSQQNVQNQAVQNTGTTGVQNAALAGVQQQSNFPFPSPQTIQQNVFSLPMQRTQNMNLFAPSLGMPQNNFLFQSSPRQQNVFQPFQNNMFNRQPIPAFQSFAPQLNNFQTIQRMPWPRWI